MNPSGKDRGEHREERKSSGRRPSRTRMNSMDQTTTIARHQRWMWALRSLMGLPAYQPACDSTEFLSGAPLDFRLGMQCGQLAASRQKDLIYSGWRTALSPEPESHSVVIRELLTIDVIDRCVPCMVDETAPLTLVSLHANEQFTIGARGLLERVAGKPKTLGQGRKRAMRRIRSLAAELSESVAPTSHQISCGDRWVQPEGAFAIRFN